MTALLNTASVQQRAQQVNSTGNFDLPCSADTAFPFFSPEGERQWAKDWDPQPVFPENIQFSRDTVFREGSSGAEAVWTILDADWQAHRAEYVRVAPASHAARIVVKVEPVGPERANVTVSYTFTAFGEHGTTLLETFSEKAYAEKMRDWQQQISACLKN